MTSLTNATFSGRLGLPLNHSSRYRWLKLSHPISTLAAAFLVVAAAPVGFGCKDKPAKDEQAAAKTPQAKVGDPSRDPNPTTQMSKTVAPAPSIGGPLDTADETDDKNQGTHQWSARIGGQKRDSAQSLALDGSGNLYVGGLIQGEVTIADTKITAQETDAVIIKLDANGKQTWVRSFGGRGIDLIEQIVLDSEGNMIVGGGFSTELKIGDSAIESAGSDDGFVAKFSADGKRLWAKRFGDVDSDNVNSVAVDSAGNIYASATLKGFVTLNGKRYEGAGQDDAFLISLDSGGNFRWIKHLRSTGKDYGRGVVASPDGSIVWTAAFSRTAALDQRNLVSAGNRDVMLAKLTADGTVTWAYSFGGLADDNGYDISIDDAGEIAMTGTFSETLTVGSLETKSAGEDDAFVVKFSADGTPRWLKSFGTRTEDVGKAVTTDRFGNVYATGWFRGSVDFGGGLLKSAGEKDIFLVKLDPNGEHLWSKRYGGKQVDFGLDVATSAKGDPLLIGTFYLTMNLGGSDLVADSGSARVPTSEMFVLKLHR